VSFSVNSFPACGIFHALDVWIVLFIMTINLAELSAEERTKIELDKQAAFIIWQIKQGQVSFDAITQAQGKLRSEQELMWFQQSIDDYKQIMGVN
jgi:hypothetical protein